MESLMSNANNQIVIEGSKSHEEQESVTIEEGQSSESEVQAAAADTENSYQLRIIPEEEQEYGCKYCQKRFSNKQALGGHQNKHKIERDMEKNELESGAGVAHFYGRMRMEAAAPYLTSFYRSPEFLHRSLYNWNFASQKPAAGGGFSYNPRAALQTASAAGFNNSLLYHGWSAAPRAPPCPQNLNISLSLANFGPGSSSGSDQGFMGFRMPSGVNKRPSTAINLRNVPEVNDESGLDLSLKL